MRSHYVIDSTRLDLVREFKANPLGPHSAELQRIVTRLRSERAAGHYVLVERVAHREWVLAQLSGKRGVDLTLMENHVFTSIEDAEWTVFKLRWQAVTGQAIDMD
jgi:hypothetical protein